MPKMIKAESMRRIADFPMSELMGAQGLPGIQGAQGPVGVQGPLGPKGDTGATGPRGDRGATGHTGASGPMGITGPQGDLGPMPQHQSRGDALRFEVQPGTWGSWIALGGTERVIGGGGGGAGAAAAALEVLDEGGSLTLGAISLDFVGNGVTATNVGDDVTVTVTDTNDHLLLSNIGVNTHAQIDTHIADATLHFTEASIDHTAIMNIGTNSHAAIDTHIADATLHFTEASIDHGSIGGLGDDDHTQYLLLLGRAGGQTAIGGTVAGNALTLQGSSAGGDVGFVDITSPTRLTYDTFSDATQFLMSWTATPSVTGSYIGGCLQTAVTFDVSTGVFIPAIFSDTNRYNIGAAPGFSAITFINELSVVANDGNFNLPSALVMNIGLTHERNTSGTSTTAGTTGVSFSPQTRTTVSGAILTKTAQTAVRCSPTYSTVAGSTVNLGTIYGLQCFAPAPALFQPAAGTENMTQYLGVYVPNITFGGASRIVNAVRSDLAAATNVRAIRALGTAQSDFGGQINFTADLVGCNYGASGDWQEAWAAAGFKYEQALTGGQMRKSFPASTRFLRDWAVDTEYTMNCVLGFSIGAQSGANGNQFGNFVAGAQTVTVGGEYSQFLLTQAGNVTVNANISAFGWTINAPAFTAGTGTLTTAAALNVGGNVNLATVNRVGVRIISNPTGGSGVNAALWVTAGRSQFDGFVDINQPIALGGGAAATLGTIGGGGPTAAAQAQWVEIEVNGVRHWIPAWT